MADVEVNNGEKAAEVEQTVELTAQERAIVDQIEYYFGDINLQRDKFMREKIDHADNPEHWVDISVLLTFNRLKKITENGEEIAEAIVKSRSDLVELSEDRLKLRRHPERALLEMNEANRKEIMSRTAYAKGFPLDSQLVDILEYFKSNFQNVQHVNMRKYFDHGSKVHKFKGSVFVTFDTVDRAEAFVVQDGVKYGEKELLRYTQERYIELKRQERETNAKKKKDAIKAKEEAEMEPLPKGAVVHFEGNTDKDVSREDIKAKIAELEANVDVAFISFQKGEERGDLRFNKENDGKALLGKLEDGKVSFCLNFHIKV